MLPGGRHGRAPEAGDCAHFFTGDPRHLLRLTQGAPLGQAILNHAFLNRTQIGQGLRMGDKHLNQFRFGKNVQTQRESVVQRRTLAAKTQRHARQRVTRIDMGKVVERFLAGSDVHPAITAAAQRCNQVRFGRLRVTVQRHRAGGISRLNQRGFLRGNGGKPCQQGVGVIIQQRGVLACFVHPRG